MCIYIYIYIYVYVTLKACCSARCILCFWERTVCANQDVSPHQHTGTRGSTRFDVVTWAVHTVSCQVQVQVVYSRLRENSDKAKLGNSKQVCVFSMSTLSVLLKNSYICI